MNKLERKIGILRARRNMIADAVQSEVSGSNKITRLWVRFSEIEGQIRGINWMLENNYGNK